MTEDQEKLLRLMVTGELYKAGPGVDPIRVLAQVVLDLVKPTPKGVAHTIRLQMEHAVDDLRHASSGVIVDNLLDILEQDPGHDVTACVVEPTKSRSAAVNDFCAIIRAIRRGE